MTLVTVMTLNSVRMSSLSPRHRIRKPILTTNRKNTPPLHIRKKYESATDDSGDSGDAFPCTTTPRGVYDAREPTVQHQQVVRYAAARLIPFRKVVSPTRFGIVLARLALVPPLDGSWPDTKM